MKIDVIGGGPAGLYFAILMKKLDPRHAITIFERNAPDDTFGWGVVFSDETLGNLEDSDPASYRSITESFARWDAIDVFVRGDRIRSGGHGFCGVSRKRLLEILHARARELGVELVFKREITDVEALRRDCDLLVGADGVKSMVRAKYEAAFVPSVVVHPNRYIWLGTRRSFEAFTFSFRENEHGVFQIHAYQFEPGSSTFIVECDAETFERAGLARFTEAESIAYCERVFAEELGGERLLGNRSSWIQFVTLTCGTWCHENVVLIGDASHTAHFSVGSGTKLAMEDAMELAAALKVAPDLASGLRSYDLGRRSMVGRIQRAAAQSRDWFENVKRLLKLPNERLAFSLLTRSRRITHDNLALRDKPYIEHVDRWHMRDAGLDPSGPLVPPVFIPFELRGMKLANRVVVSPMCQYSAEDGTPDEWQLVHLGSRAIGGAGLVMTEMTDVLRDGRISPGCTGMYKDEHERGWARVVDYVHRHSNAKIGLQLAHAGRKGSTNRPWEGSDIEPLAHGNWEIIGPSAIAYGPNRVPREMTRADMVAVRDAFVAAAKRGLRCGFDLLELHYAHGYLLSSFLTPVSNQRGDEYGGSLANRARYPLEVLDAVRQVWPDKPLSVRISATDWVEGGFDGDDAVELSGWLKAHGADIIDVSSGQTTPDAQPVYGRAYQTPFSERVRLEAGIPTITVGAIDSADMIDTILVAGRADLVALARAHLADPYFTLHAAAARGYDAMPWPVQYLSGKPRLR